jgi:ATP-dependent helicase/nuclease subunit B
VSVHLYVAPAASGKTAYVLNQARKISQGLTEIPRVCLPTHLQVRSWRRRLAQEGGALGVRLMTFDKLYAECLNLAGEVYTELSEPVQYRLIRFILDDLSPAYYAPLTTRPGFIRILQEMIAELKAARVWPGDFARAVAAMGDEPRLSELAQVYGLYQEHLQKQRWADRAGLGWLAVEALRKHALDLARDWPMLIVDGFDNFTPVQMELLKLLSERVETLTITLTGTADGAVRELAHRRFNETRWQIEQALDTKAKSLPERTSRHDPLLLHLESSLFQREKTEQKETSAVELIESPDREGEVRAALRWLKERLVTDHLRPGEVALLARSMSPYRPFILQTAAEFGLPIRLVDGIPLRTSPVIAAILDLLRLMLPGFDDTSQPALPRRLVIEAWRSPYFDWATAPSQGEAGSISIASGDADVLDAIARWSQIIGGLAQWEQGLDNLVNRSAEDKTEDDERDPPGRLPLGTEAQVLKDKFDRFVRRITPPATARCYRDWVVWLEGIIGPDPTLESFRTPNSQIQSSLQVVARAYEADPEVAEWDVAALQSLKDGLRGLVWAEEVVQDEQAVDYPQFFRELLSVVEATTYRPPSQPAREVILVADVIQARGIPFQAVAVLGLAEGEFPASLREDTFLRDSDRKRLREEYGLPLQPSTESAEAGLFYEAITRSRSRLLLTRPRLADNGAPWQASPYWEEVSLRLEVEPRRQNVPRPHLAASWPELMESLSTYPGYEGAIDWVQQQDPVRHAALERSTQTFHLRQAQTSDSPLDGNLSSLRGEFALRFGPDHIWSISRLESYRACPFLFFSGHVLKLEPRVEPTEGLDVRQLGNIYHVILEKLYQSPEITDSSDLDQLLAALPAAAKPILDEAPHREGFRETAWWEQTCAQILDDIQQSLMALDALAGGFIPCSHEIRFWEPDALAVIDGKDQFQVHGLIDRIDRDNTGQLRIIDYKTSHPASFTKRTVSDGKRLQLPLYALAARDALNLGKPVEGFYWHVRHAEPSPFTLSKFDGGAESAMETATTHAWEAIHNIRDGYFVPDPPSDGCPSYCPAAGYCWHYRSGFGG